MSGEPVQRSTAHGLVFLMFLSFIASFLVARVFATLNPGTVVVTGGIQFHHFWYGLAMIVVAGALGIVHQDPRFRRLYAVLFGLGGGLVGDEVGLLLTLGNYNSLLTLYFFVIVVTGGVLVMLLARYRTELKRDVLSIGHGERLIYLGVMVAGLSTLSFAVGFLLFGVVTMSTGIVIVAGGLRLHKSRSERRKHL